MDGTVVQTLPCHISRELGSIMSSSYCLCRVSVCILSVCMKTCRLVKLNSVGVNECVNEHMNVCVNGSSEFFSGCTATLTGIKWLMKMNGWIWHAILFLSNLKLHLMLWNITYMTVTINSGSLNHPFFLLKLQLAMLQRTLYNEWVYLWLLQEMLTLETPFKKAK